MGFDKKVLGAPTSVLAGPCLFCSDQDFEIESRPRIDDIIENRETLFGRSRGLEFVDLIRALTDGCTLYLVLTDMFIPSTAGECGDALTNPFFCCNPMLKSRGALPVPLKRHRACFVI